MAQTWLSPGSWTHEQWLIMSILGFIIIAVVYVSFRLAKILRSLNTKRELPNLRLGRRPRR